MEKLCNKLLDIINEQDFCFTPEEMCIVTKAANRFAAYENIDLKPEEITALLARFEALPPSAEGWQKERNYIVVATNVYISELKVEMFETEADAVAYLKKLYQNELKKAKAKNGWRVSGKLLDNGWYARIRSGYPDQENVMEFRLGKL